MATKGPARAVAEDRIVHCAVLLGLCALLCTLVAQQTILRLREMHPFARNTAAFLAAFATYEVTLIVFSLGLGGMENFTLAIQARIFALNALALVGLFALNRAGIVIGITAPALSPCR